MEGKIPEEFDTGFVRIPLIDLSTATERPSSAPASAVASESVVARAITPTTPSAKGKKGKEPPPEEIKEETEEEKPKWVSEVKRSKIYFVYSTLLGSSLPFSIQCSAQEFFSADKKEKWGGGGGW